jgi:hypothetical protein
MGRNGIRWVGPHWQTVGRLTLRLIVPPWALRADLEQATDADKQRIEPLVERDREGYQL